MDMIGQLIALYGNNHEMDIDDAGVQHIIFRNDEGGVVYHGRFHPESEYARVKRFLANFRLQHDFRVGKAGQEHVWLVQYKDTTLAIFHGYNSQDDARQWCLTHGHLAEWMYQKIVKGQYVNWEPEMALTL